MLKGKMPCSPHKQIIENNNDYKGVQHLTFDRILFVGVVTSEWGVQLVAKMIVDKFCTKLFSFFKSRENVCLLIIDLKSYSVGYKSLCYFHQNYK